MTGDAGGGGDLAVLGHKWQEGDARAGWKKLSSTAGYPPAYLHACE